MPHSLDELTSLFTGGLRVDRPEKDFDPSELEPLLAGLDLLANVPDQIVLSDLLPLEQEDESPSLPDADDIEEAVITLTRRSHIPSEPERRQLAQAVWSDLTRPFRKWFFLQVAQSIATHINASRPSETDVATENTKTLPSANEPTEGSPASTAPRTPSPQSIQHLREIAPDEWEAYVLSHWAGLTIAEIGEMTEHTQLDVQSLLAVAEASLSPSAGASHG